LIETTVSKLTIAAHARRVVIESMVFIDGYGDLGPDQLTRSKACAHA
jgi:hypothetical protein